MDLVQTDFQLTNASGKPAMRLEIKFSSETCFWHLLAIDVAAVKMQRYLALPSGHGFAGNAESQCSIICRALRDLGAVC